MTTLPDDVRKALLKAAKAWVLNNYIGGRKRLEQWSDHYASLTQIHSYSLPGDRAKNLRRLVKLTKAGVLVEHRRYRDAGGVRCFTAPRPVLDEIGRQAVNEWIEAGYSVGETMDEIKGSCRTSDEHTEPPWCDCKVAYGFDCDPEDIWRAFDRYEPGPKYDLPKGWEFIGTDGTGARFVAKFRVKTIPDKQDGEKVLAVIQQLSASAGSTP